MSKKKKNMPKNQIDMISSFIYLLCTLFFIWSLFHLGMIPSKYIILIAAIFLILFFIQLILDILDYRGWIKIAKRICCGLLSVILVVGGVFISRASSSLNRFNDDSNISTSLIQILALQENTAASLADLSNSQIGYQSSSDQANADYAISKILDDETISNVTYHEYDTYPKLVEALYNHEIDAMIFTSSYLPSINEQFEDFNSKVKVIQEYKREVEHNSGVTDKDLVQTPFTVYVTGIDQLGDPSVNSHSDVNILLMIDPKNNHIEMVSIPRDAYVPNADLNYYPDKLTHTGNTGVDNIIRSMEGVFGIDIDYYAKASFSSVIEIVDALGGIEVNVPVAFCEQDENRSFASQDLICLNEGTQLVNGKQALAFARHRKSYGDLQRNMAQQEVIKGMVNAALTPSGITKIPNLLEIAPNYISTNLPMNKLRALINDELENVQPWSFSSVSMENGANDMLPTASMGSDLPLSVYILSQYDINNVYQKYLSIFEPSKLSDFEFNLNNLQGSGATPILNPNLITTENVSTKIYNYYSLEYPTEEIPPVCEEGDENCNPETNEPMVDENGNPLEPIDPTDPNIPSEPIDPNQPDLPSEDQQNQEIINPVQPIEPDQPVEQPILPEEDYSAESTLPENPESAFE